MAASKIRPPRIPTLCRHKANNLAVVRLNGKDVYCGTYGTTEAKAKYDQIIAEWLQRGRQLAPGTGESINDKKNDPTSTASAPQTGLVLSQLMLGYQRHAADYYRYSPKELERIRLSMRPM